MIFTRGNDGRVHILFGETTRDDLAHCGVFYEQRKRISADFSTCLYCIARRAEREADRKDGHG